LQHPEGEREINELHIFRATKKGLQKIRETRQALTSLWRALPKLKRQQA